MERLVDVFSEVRRVLKQDGTCWVNMGDSYASNGGSGVQGKTGQRSDRRFTATRDTEALRVTSSRPPNGLKAKDLIGQPWRLAFALQDSGWYLRQDIIWHKPTPMPESVKDRCTKAHEYLFLLTKSERYFWDQSAMMEPVTGNSHARASKAAMQMVAQNRERGAGACSSNPLLFGVNPKSSTDQFQVAASSSLKQALVLPVGLRNKRSVWTIPSEPFSGAHFATFPSGLVKPCVLAGCPLGGTVLDPFGGSGTTAAVAIELGRKAILCELNPDYVSIARQRISSVTPGLHLETSTSRGNSGQF